MKRKASAIWSGNLKDGKGTLTTESGVLSSTPYSFRTRFESEKGTNPEELIGAAHAGCFTMALSKILGDAGMTAEKLETEATVTLEQKDGGFAVTASHLEVKATIPGADAAAFQKYAEAAEKGCPVSKVLNAKISMTAKLG